MENNMSLPANIIVFDDHRPVNPQKEDGYMAIANEIMEALCRAYIPARERQCLDFILRKTYGWDKKEDDISLSQFKDGTGLPIRKVRDCLKSLISKNLIGMHANVHTPKGKKQNLPSTYWFNKRYDTWKIDRPNKKGMHNNRQGVCTLTGNGVCTPTCNTITNIQEQDISPKKSSDKPTPKEKSFSTELCKFVGDFIDYVIKEKGNKAPKKTKRLINTSLDTVDKLIRIDGFTLEYIRAVARWAVVDKFYSTSFFSLASLRNKSKTNDVSKFINMASRYDKEVGTVKNGPPPTIEEICKSYGL